MKVLIFSFAYPNKYEPTFGIFVEEQIKFLKKYCDIKVVAPVPYFPNIPISSKWKKYSEISHYVKRNDIEIYHPRFPLFPKNILRNKIGLLMYYTTRKLVKKIKNKWNFDLIHAHFSQPSGIAAVKISRDLNVPLIISEHYGKFHIDIKKNSFLRKQILKTINQSKRIIAVSERISNDLKSLNIKSEKISVIPNGVDIEKFPLVQMKREKKHNILSIGHLVELKGYQILIQSIKILKEKYKNIHLTIIGEGEYRKSLEALITNLNLSKHIELIGYIPNDKLNLYLQNSDIYVHPSFFESFSIAVIEALASGLPVVVTKSGGPEYFVNEKVGKVVEKGDEQKLSLAIKNMIKDYNYYNPIEIRKYCIENFDIRNVVKQIFNVYKEILKG